MPDLISKQAKICYTAAGTLLHDNKVLLVKHKKLGIWLNPGGHIESDELPHQAAEREFLEEAGIAVTAITAMHTISGSDSEYLPVPLLVNLHWVSQENYDHRQGISQRSAATEKNWAKGCEQHLGFLYLVKPVAGIEFTVNTQETLGISWFAENEIKTLETTEDLKKEIYLAFEMNRSN